MSAPIGRVLTGAAGVLAPALAALVSMVLVVGVPAAAAHGRDDALRSWADGEGRAAIATVQSRATGTTPNSTAEEAMVAAVAPLPVLTRHLFATAPLAATWDGGTADLVLAALRAEDGPDFFFDRSGREPLGGIAAGRMPESAGEAIVEASVAERLDLDLGDVVRIDGRDDLEIVGVWSPSSAGLRLLNAAGLARGGLITTDEAVFVGDSAPFERWMLEVDPTRFDAAALAGSTSIAERITAALEATGIPTAGIVVQDTLTPELQRLATGVDAAGRILAGFTVVGGAVALVALVQLGGLLASARSAELDLVRTRGASRRRIGASVGVVVGLAALAGATAAAAVIGILALLGPLVLDPLALLVAPLALGLTAGAAVGTACSTAAGPHSARRGILASAATPLALISVVVVATLSVIALWTGAEASPFVVAAPALALLAALAIIIVVTGPVARVLASGRLRGSAALVAMRRIARRPRRFAPVTAIIAIQVGIVVLAAATTGSAQSISTDARLLDAGAAVRAVGVLGDDPGPTGAAVITERLEWGGEQIDLVSMTPDAAAGTISPVDGIVDPDGIAAALSRPEGQASDGIGTVLGDGPLALTVESSRVAELWFADAAGTLVHRTAETGTVSVNLPAGADWHLLAIEGSTDDHGRWGIDRLAVDGRAVDVDGWIVAPERASADGVIASVVAIGDGLAIEAARIPSGLAVDPLGSISTETVRLVPGDLVVVPAVIDAAVADTGGLVVGDTIAARVSGAGRVVEGVVASVVSAIPGTGTVGGVMLESRALIAAQLRTAESPPIPDERWFGAADAEAALTFVWSDSVTVVTAAPGVHDRLVSTATSAAWVTTAIALVLTVIALVAAVGQRRRLDRTDAAALRAMGMDAAGMRATWWRETAPLAAGAMVIGLAGGLAAAAATVPIVTWRAAPVPPALIDPVLRVDVIGVVVALVVVAIVIVAVLHRGAVAAGRSASVDSGDGGTVR